MGRINIGNIKGPKGDKGDKGVQGLRGIQGPVGPMGTIDETTPIPFEEATTRQELQSNDAISSLFGKVKKYFTDLKAVAFSGAAEDLTYSNTESQLAAVTTQAAIDEIYSKLTEVTDISSTFKSAVVLSNFDVRLIGGRFVQFSAVVKAGQTGWLSEDNVIPVAYRPIVDVHLSTGVGSGADATKGTTARLAKDGRVTGHIASTLSAGVPVYGFYTIAK